MKKQHIQRDFSGGEVGARVAMRDDAAFHGRSVATMENFIPTVQGTAVRCPGTRYVYTPASSSVRLIPYLTPANERGMIELTPLAFKVIPNIDVYLEGTLVDTQADTPVWRQQHPNPSFVFGLSDWSYVPAEYTSGGDQLGIWYVAESNAIAMVARNGYKSGDIDTCVLSSTVTIPEDETVLKLDVSMEYRANYSSPNSGRTITIELGTTAGSGDLWTYNYTKDVGSSFQDIITVNGTFTAGQTLHMTVTLVATETNEEPYSTPYILFKRFAVYSRELVDLGDATLTGVTPYTAADLKDVHFVQSPYPNSVQFDIGHELVFTHPRHPVQELIFNPNTPAYVWRDKVFTNAPGEWGVGGYPASCTSYQGRLILAGSKDKPDYGEPISAAPSETVWGTEVGLWSAFSLDDDVNPDDSIEFTAIYRSPIQWVYGQKALLIGAVEMEYIASADGIFSPGDLGVEMHSTHGSNNVQPVGLGQKVLFPAEGGTRVRAMGFHSVDKGWVSEDMTILHPGLCRSKIVRMVRMRNPQQLVVVLLGNGQLAVLSYDTYANVSGWSRVALSGFVKDICVVTGENGNDQLFCVVNRTVNGQQVTYVEVIANWAYSTEWQYIQSYSTFLPETPTNVITGLEHLEGETVQVIANSKDYLGTFVVSDGTVTLTDQAGLPIVVNEVTVGLVMPAILRTLAIISDDPASKKRYPAVYVRTIGSTRPIINNDRPPDRTPSTIQGRSESRDVVKDHQIPLMGFSATPIITVEENVPLNVEVVGIFGSVASNSV